MSEKMRGNDAVENAALGLLRASERLTEAVAKGNRDLYEMRQMQHTAWPAPSKPARASKAARAPRAKKAAAAKAAVPVESEE